MKRDHPEPPLGRPGGGDDAPTEKYNFEPDRPTQVGFEFVDVNFEALIVSLQEKPTSEHWLQLHVLCAAFQRCKTLSFGSVVSCYVGTRPARHCAGLYRTRVVWRCVVSTLRALVFVGRRPATHKPTSHHYRAEIEDSFNTSAR